MHALSLEYVMLSHPSTGSCFVNILGGSELSPQTPYTESPLAETPLQFAADKFQGWSPDGQVVARHQEQDGPGKDPTCICTLNQPVSSDWGDCPRGAACKLGPCRCPDQQVAVPLPQRSGVPATQDCD